ncbi:rod-binding protein [Pigmentibacter sp. JX0631]|uniref:rod-binding protein n=1 Tax=Pigmentibacter sp. JX0631 TaxID=2976982 RepID=UPI002469AF76|nr:rod-binding protein [Pigmentibacter sp. JX0631]WGL60798.1 rod-binding protein [Pigmentibacter sp. JX0631]
MRINLMDSATKYNSNELSTNEISNEKPLSEFEKKKIEKLKEAQNVAKEFESIYLDMMIKSMRQTAKPEDESNAHDIFQSMLDGEYSKLMADSQNFGIRDLVLNWMKENDPMLNPNLKTLNSKSLENEIKSTRNTINEIKNNNYLNKFALDQYKIELNK